MKSVWTIILIIDIFAIIAWIYSMILLADAIGMINL